MGFEREIADWKKIVGGYTRTIALIDGHDLHAHSDAGVMMDSEATKQMRARTQELLDEAREYLDLWTRRAESTPS